MVAVRKRIESAPFRDTTGRFGRLRGVDALIPAVASTVVEEPPRPAKQTAHTPADQSARWMHAVDLRIATNSVVAGLARIAFADIGDLFDERGAPIPFAELPPGVRAAVAEYTVRHGRNGACTVSVRLHSKLAALVALGRHLGMFGPHPSRATHAGAEQRCTLSGGRPLDGTCSGA